MTHQHQSIAILCLDGYVSMYAETLRQITWLLKKEKLQHHVIGCNRALSTCTSINSLGKTKLNPIQKESICCKCINSQRQLHSDSPIFDISKRVNPEQELFVDAISSTLFAQRTLQSVINMPYQSINLCQIAFFDFSIKNKVSQTSNLDNEQIQDFLGGLRDLFSIKSNLDSFLKSHPVTAFIYINGNYSQNTFVREYTKNKNILCWSVEPQLFTQSLFNKITFKINRLELEQEALFAVKEMTARFNKDDIKRVLHNFQSRINGAEYNAYTNLDNTLLAKTEVSELVGFLKEYKKVHSYFLSSEDELTPHITTHNLTTNGSIESRFSSQFEFTEYFIKQAHNAPEIGFIVRLHPRMAVNKRDSFESEEHKKYKHFLSNQLIPKNLMIILGDSKISSYYLASKSTLVIVSWSTFGIESLLMGVPVVSAFPKYLMYPLEQFVAHPTTIEALTACIFSGTTPPKIDDLKLIYWTTNAYESQFQTILTFRNSGGFKTLFRRGFNLVFNNNYTYPVASSVFNKVFKSSNALLKLSPMGNKTQPNSTLRGNSDLSHLQKYREKTRKTLDKYSDNLKKSLQAEKLD
ncbi:hypothetical protein [Methylophilus aquaticus]|uniref:Capsule polysaccharide biosynthesis protein n=1 Tax=Methylophilus aquaticus TaxID=1971610 RepID=A0ABT9JU88_9PROT|nr:hypothetical protein [Methylophilus aquaticus]MDP8568086.1 hypothetical protein [Methylophilus aquaticus]